MSMELLNVSDTKSTFNVAGLCGAQFCPGVGADDIPNLMAPHPLKIQLLAGIFLALMVAACALVALGTDSLGRYEMGRKSAGTGLSGLRLLEVTLRHLGQTKQLLLVPITMFIGAEQAFMAVDFTAVSSRVFIELRAHFNGVFALSLLSPAAGAFRALAT